LFVGRGAGGHDPKLRGHGLYLLSCPQRLMP
jgi:hypothetical protein